MACGSSSDLNYSRTTDVRSTLLYSLNSNLKNNEENLVCLNIDSGKGVDYDTFVFEFKLSMVHWLGDVYPNLENIINSIQFSQRCSVADLNNSVLEVKIPDAEHMTNEESIFFVEPKAKCQIKKNKPNCRLSNIVFALAERGKDLGYVRGRKVVKRARILFNPYIKWQGLGEEFNLQLKPILKNGYNNIIKSREFNIASTRAYTGRLNQDKVIALDARASKQTLEKAKKHGRYIKLDTRPVSALYPTLLHELGHVFGLDHSDARVTGSVTGDKHGEESHSHAHRTYNTAMASDSRYLYLTEDDKAGIKSLKALIW